MTDLKVEWVWDLEWQKHTSDKRMIPVVRLEALREPLERILFLDGYNGYHMHHEARERVRKLWESWRLHHDRPRPCD